MKCGSRRKHRALGALSLVGTGSANRIFQLNAVGSLNPCDFCCLPREGEEHLVPGKRYPLFSCPQTLGKISQTLRSAALTPSPPPQPSLWLPAWCHIPLRPRRGNSAQGPRRGQEHTWTPRRLGHQGRGQQRRPRQNPLPAGACSVCGGDVLGFCVGLTC